MKMKAGQKIHYDAGPNMTPLVDVVMVILIFLMLTGSFAVGERFLQSNMPVTKKGAAQAGGFMIQNNSEQLVVQLTRMRDALNKNNQPTDKIQVIINPGRQTKYQHLIDVYQAANRASFTKVS